MTSFRASLLRITLALGLSFAIWAFVSFSQNPEETVNFPEMPLETIGLGESLVIVDTNGLPNQALPVVSISLRTDRQQLTVLRPVDVRAVADLTGLGAGEHMVPVNVQPTRSNVSFLLVSGGVEPSAVPIRLEQLSTQQMAVEVAVQGNLPFSFERGEPKVSRAGAVLTTVQVAGPQSRVARVKVVRATANIEQLRATYLAPLSLEALDASGQSIEGVRLEPSTVTVQIPINPVVGLKLVPVAPKIIGLPAAGYEVRGVLVEPPLIALAGSSGPLDAVDVLSTAPFDLGGAHENQARNVAISFPEGTSPREGEPTVARVTVQIAPLSLPFQIQLPAQAAVTGVGAGLFVGTGPLVVSFTLAGTNEALAGLAQMPLRATVDVSGMGPGSYTLPVSVELPKGVRLVGDPPRLQVSLHLPPPTSAPVTPTDMQGTATATPPGEAVSPTTPTAVPTVGSLGTPTTVPLSTPTTVPLSTPTAVPLDTPTAGLSGPRQTRATSPARWLKPRATSCRRKGAVGFHEAHEAHEGRTAYGCAPCLTRITVQPDRNFQQAVLVHRPS